MKYIYLFSFLSFPLLQLYSQAVDTTFGEPYSFVYPQIEYIPGITASDFDARADRSNAILFLEDDRIIVAGHSYGGDNNDFVFTRLLPDGKYDQSAGPDGEVRLDLGFTNDSCLSSALYQSNRLLMGGCAGPDDEDGCKALIIKTDFDGNLDNEFGDQGQVLIDLPGTWDMMTEIIPMADGKIIIAGNIYYGASFKSPDSTNIFIGRLEANGQIDNTFGTDGFVYSQLGNCVASILGDIYAYDDGSLLITGAGYSPYPGLQYDDFTCNPNIHLYRFTEAGTPHPDFGNNGITRLPVTEGRGNTLYVYEDGRIVVAGMTSDFFLEPIYTIVARLLPDGTRDSTFNGNGYFREYFHGELGYGAEPLEIFLIDDELLIGYLDGSLGASVTFGAFCLTDEGQMNLDFGQDGIFDHVSLFPPIQYTLSDVRLSQDEQSMFFGGTYRLLGNDNMFISKLDISDKNPTNVEKEVNQIDIKIFPNPTFGHLNILTKSQSLLDSKIHLYNSFGQQMMVHSIQSDRNTLQLHGLQTGIYFYEIRKEGVLLRSGKLIKAK